MRHAALAVALAVAIPSAAQAQSIKRADAAGEDLVQLRARLDRLQQAVGAQEQRIAELKAQLLQWQMAQRGRGVAQDTPASPSPSPSPAPSAADAAPAQQTIGQAQQQDDSERREQERALVVQEHAPLFERKFTLDIGQSYSYYDRRQLALSGFLALDAIFLGTINLDQTKASVFTTDVTARYGLTDRLNLELNVPYVLRDSRFVSGGAGGASSTVSEVGLRSRGIGDASVAGYYQLVKESAGWPDMVASLRVRAPTGRDPFGLKIIAPDANNNNLNVPEDLPTGSGLWNATLALSVLRSYDPVILFGNLGYSYNAPRRFGDISPVLGQIQPARVELGNPVLLSGGVAIALNDRAALSFSVASSIAGATHIVGEDGERQRVAGSSTNTTTFNVGASYVLPSLWTVNGQLTMGLTPDAPNFMFGMRASHAF